MTEDGKPLANGDDPQHPGDGTGNGTDDAAQRGRMRYQDAESTTPREPTLAEKRARIAAEQRQQEAAAAELAEAARKTQTRRRVMVGGGVTVGVVALVAAFYSAAEYTAQRDAVTQFCAADQPGQTVAQREDLCDENYVNTNGGHVNHGTGMFFMPILLPGGAPSGKFNQYRYGYTSPGAAAPTVGQSVPSNFSKPADSNIKNTKGGTVQRGGFGIGNKSGSGGS